MIALIQRVLEASVAVDSQLINQISGGLLVLLGIRNEDSDTDAAYLAAKTANLRIFNDDNGKMNLSILETGGEVLVISQFTLHADTRHGNRPSFTDACEPEKAEHLYNYYIDECRNLLGHNRVFGGKFGTMMKIKLINDGPVTIILKSKNEH